MNDREFISSIRDQCDAQLGGGGSAGGTPTVSVAAVTVKPSPFTDVGAGNQDPREVTVTPGQVVGVAFTIQAGAKNERRMKWFGSPGQFWSRNSWAIFDSGGTRVFFADNALVAGSLGTEIDTATLSKLGAGNYTVGVALNGAGTVAFQFVQN